MELMPGYKQTEVGVIPDEWDCLLARDFGVFKGGSGFPLWAQGQRSGEYPFFKVSDMNNEGNETFMTAANHYISEQTRKQLGAQAFPADSIVFAKVGAAVFLERKKILGQPSCIDNNMAAYVLDGSRADVRFVHSLLLMKKLGALVATTALPALNGKQLGEMVLPLPPLPEQRAIAQVLSDVDTLLATLDQMIAKKRDLIRAAMQQLLTGKTRLPEFGGEWVVVRLDELASLYQPQTISAKLFTDAGFPVYGANGVVGFYHSSNHETWQVTVTCRGSTCGTVNRTVNECWITGNAMVLNCDSNRNLNKDFFYYLMLAQDMSDCITGTGQPQIVRAPLSAFKVCLPTDLDEQVAIAKVLSEMDVELAVLEARRDKTCNIKQAMMQELLNGKTRLA